MSESNVENASGLSSDKLNPTRGVAGFAQGVPLAEAGLPALNTARIGSSTAANATQSASELQTPNDAQEITNPVLIIAQRNRLAVDKEVERNHALGLSEWKKY